MAAISTFMAFITRTRTQTVDILDPIQFSGLIIGAMIPYAISSLAVGNISKIVED
jgi:Na+/H+-translocating membrane pyrophosphatase